MSASKIMAERALLDMRGIVLALLDVAYGIDESNPKTVQESSLRRLRRVKRDIRRLKERYYMDTSLYRYYEPSITARKLTEFVSTVERRDSEAIEDLRHFDKVLKEAISSVLGEF